MKKFEIIGGPSKQELIDAFAHAYDYKSATVQFTCRGDKGLGVRLTVRVTSLGYECGHPDCLLVGGIVLNPPLSGYDRLGTSFYHAEKRGGSANLLCHGDMAVNK